MPATQARKELVSQQVRYAEAQDLSVKSRSLRAGSYERISTLDSETDAQSIADEVLALRKVRQNILLLNVKNQQFKRNIGDTVTLSIDDFNPGSQDGIILNITESFDKDSTTLMVLV